MNSNEEWFLVEEREEILVNIDGTANLCGEKSKFVKPYAW